MNQESKRIIYVDIMRAFAVIMMIQGHTVDTFLADEYRTMDSIFYSVWHAMRGFTAPIFMFTSGLVFTYLLKADQYEFFKNPRVKKGIKRGLVLILIGYLLRYPTAKIIDFSNVNQNQWNIFFSVDALHLIGFGLLIIILSLYLSKNIGISLSVLFYVYIGFIIIFSSFITKVDWILYIPQFMASYFTKAYGSLFPLFPWLIYVIAGALLGNYLYKNPGIYLKKRFSLTLIILGMVSIVVSLLFFYFQSLSKGEISYWFFYNGVIIMRVGGVILVSGVMSMIVRKVDTIPDLILETGKKTLMLYVIHIIVLYGCAWFPGLYRYYSKSFSTLETILAVILMFIAMFSLVQLSRKFSFLRKFKLSFTKV